MGMASDSLLRDIHNLVAKQLTGVPTYMLSKRVCGRSEKPPLIGRTAVKNPCLWYPWTVVNNETHGCSEGARNITHEYKVRSRFNPFCGECRQTLSLTNARIYTDGIMAMVLKSSWQRSNSTWSGFLSLLSNAVRKLWIYFFFIFLQLLGAEAKLGIF